MRFKTSGFLKQVCKVKDILSIREWFDESEPVLSSSIFKSPFGECFILYLSSVLPRVISTLKNIVLFVSGGRKAKRMHHFFLEFEKYSFIIFGIKVICFTIKPSRTKTISHHPDILNWWSGKFASSFVSSIHNTSTEAFDNTSGWKWVGPVRRAGSPRWDDFHPTFICNLLPQFNQSVCYIAGKGLFDKVVFSINSDVKASCRTNVLILFN